MNQIMEKDLISVVMPVYNGAKYLKEAIESILNQSYNNIELVIIDDGSKDSSADIIKSFNDKRIVYIKNEQNMGISKSLNRGIEIARGDYIARMDCDDISLPDRLKVQHKYMSKHPGIGLCGTWVRFFGKSNGLMTYPVKDDSIKAFLNFRCTFAHPSVMLRRSLLLNNNLRYDKDSIIEDYELWTRCQQYTQMHNIPHIYLKYRIVEGSLSHNESKAQMIYNEKSRILKKLVLYNLGVQLTDREMTVHISERDEYISKAITLREVGNLLDKLYKANKIIKKYSYHALNGMLSYKWYEVCYAYSSNGIKVFNKYFFSRYNGILHRPWHAARLLLKCIRKG